ncbi:hypothetical protein EHQ68_09260 [Leptospira congkakensis]|uniref:Uncharacterized protein n=1 Tax=Leptospira congkakensis TaxID=2484932 RepID=A0A4Z1AB08_9LEPT|nr:hypothetical protein [Leptospira congkakensis]TGL88812.1 hypothetical protein EHQ69_15330 [Leptospira congkakensis]TGL89398.1 hypothetical protein EHQ68_09260 [Leptospira congkakensis]TGL97366.1 hypothetical protein EHQ70_08755 [Leptospira congkakensis]
MRVDRKISIKAKEKELIRLDRELSKIRDEINSLPSIELKKPIFHSYGLVWSLKLQTSKYKEAYLFIIEAFSKIKRVKNLRKVHQMEPEPISLDKGEYRKLAVKYPDAIRWFIKRKNKFNSTEYAFNKVDILEKKIVKVMITHRKDIDPNLESRRREIEDLIYTNRDNSGKLDNLFGNRYEYTSEYYKLKLELFDLINPIRMDT